MYKYLKAIKHLSPNRFVFIALAAFFLLYIFVFLDKDNVLRINRPASNIANRYLSSRVLPVAADHPNVTGAIVVYTFSGAVDSIRAGDVRLVAKDGSLPNFKINSLTPIFWGEGQKAKPAQTSDLKPGVAVSISANYIVGSGEWRVSRITINK